MNGLQNHRQKSIQMNSIHHMIIFNIGIYDSVVNFLAPLWIKMCFMSSVFLIL
jgi:hypothetical protein